jgi:hypothetical protein
MTVKMMDFLNLIMLICASIGSLAFGVLGAYWILRVGFSLMRPQRRTGVPVRSEIAPVV